MREWIEPFLEYLARERGLTDNTVAAYRNDLQQYVKFLETRQRGNGHGLAMSSGDWHHGREAVVSFLLSLKEDHGYAPATVARKIAAVKSLYHYLQQRGVITQDPTADLSAPEVKRRLPRAMSAEAVQKLLGHVETGGQAEGLRDRAMLRLLYATGMRVSELVSLDVSDLDLERQSVSCTGRSARVRHIPVEAEALQAVKDYLEHGRTELIRANGPEPALFLNHRGLRLTRQGFWLIMKLRAREAGITEPITPHMLRHSFAAHRLHAGVELQQLKEMLGHANISTTQMYVQLSQEPRRSPEPSPAASGG